MLWAGEDPVQHLIVSRDKHPHAARELGAQAPLRLRGWWVLDVDVGPRLDHPPLSVRAADLGLVDNRRHVDGWRQLSGHHLLRRTPNRAGGSEALRTGGPFSRSPD